MYNKLIQSHISIVYDLMLLKWTDGQPIKLELFFSYSV
jgi:hypothetical protein